MAWVEQNGVVIRYYTLHTIFFLLQAPLGICQLYTGTTCEPFLKNQTVFIPLNATVEMLEDNLRTAYYGVIKESKDMNPNCRGYALPSLCYSVLPICRTPEKTNHQYFRNKAIAMEEQRQRYVELTTTTTTTTPTTTTTASTPTTTTSTTAASTATTEPSVEHVQKPKAHKSIHEKKGSLSRKMKGQKTVTTTQSTTTEEAIPVVTSAPAESFGDLEPTSLNSEITFSVRKKRSFEVTIDASTKFVKSKHFVHDDHVFVHDDHVVQASTLGKMTSLAETEAFKKHYPPTRSTENLRRICRNECELLENELCQKEYAIAKRHPAIGQILPLEDCYNLPEDTTDCSSLGIAIDVDENERCYWENGAGYRGTVALSQSGKPCLTWARLMKEIADFPELAGQNYCR